MLPILGRPIMVRVMDRLREAGIRRFVVVIGEQDGAIATYLARSWYPDTEVEFAIQTAPTGTVDALKLALPAIDGPFVLSSVDNLTSAEHVADLLNTFNSAAGCVAALSLLPAKPEQIRVSSGVVIDGSRITAIEEKPSDPRGTHASIMLYAFDTDILKYLDQVAVSPRGEREIASAIQLAINNGDLVTYAIANWRLHLTREADLLSINKVYLAEGRDTNILSEIPATVTIIPPVRIDPNVSVGQSVRLGPNVYLESGSSVGDEAVLDNTLVLARAVVAAGSRCSGEIIDPRVSIAIPNVVG